MDVVVFGPRPEDGRHEILCRLDASRFDVSFGRATPESVGRSSCFVPLNLSDYSDLEFCEKYARRKFLTPHKRTVALCNDKLEFNRYLVGRGFGANIPKCYYGTVACRPKFPYLLKRRRSNWGVGTSIILSAANETFEEVAVKLGTGDYFIQECIIGSTEYALHILADHGEVLFHSTVVYTAPEQIYVKGHALEFEECR